MYVAQVFETELINTLTALETAASPRPTRKIFDELYAKHESLTFGNLMREHSKHSFIPGKLMEEIRACKSERDHLAHRFFRDNDLNGLTVGGCYVMIEQLEKRRLRFQEMDRRVSEYGTKAYERIGFDAERLRAATEETKAEMCAEARAGYSSPVPWAS